MNRKRKSVQVDWETIKTNRKTQPFWIKLKRMVCVPNSIVFQFNSIFFDDQLKPQTHVFSLWLSGSIISLLQFGTSDESHVPPTASASKPKYFWKVIINIWTNAVIRNSELDWSMKPGSYFNKSKKLYQGSEFYLLFSMQLFSESHTDEKMDGCLQEAKLIAAMKEWPSLQRILPKNYPLILELHHLVFFFKYYNSSHFRFTITFVNHLQKHECHMLVRNVLGNGKPNSFHLYRFHDQLHHHCSISVAACSTKILSVIS